MQFTYDHGIPTVESAMEQAVGYFIRSGNEAIDGVLDRAVAEVARVALKEIRDIFTSEMSTLFDTEQVALDWNQAVERCIQLVEGSL